MSRIARSFTILFILSSILLPTAAGAQDTDVKAVLFYSPTCPHCHEVIREDLPILWQQYGGEIEMYYSPPAPGEQQQGPAFVAFFGDQLSILHVDISTPEGSQLFIATLEAFELPDDAGVVPTLFVGDVRLVGSAQIPDEFPGIIEQGLAQGGIDWPPLPGLNQILSGLVPVPTEETTAEATPDGEVREETPPVISNEETSVIERFQQDTLGNAISTIILVGMLISVVFVGSRIVRQPTRRDSLPISRGILLLAVIGIGVAGYLSYVETTGTEAVCGPVGDCNSVQNSSYAVLFGVLPIGVLGFVGYFAILTAWIWSHLADQRITDYATFAIFAMATFGTVFSIYLTFLEPFVIGATCAWCLASAILITAIMILSMQPATLAWARLRNSERKQT